MVRIALSVVAFLVFTVYTVTVIVNHSFLGFLADHAKGGWSLQIFLDLVCAAICFWIVGVPDAKSRKINPWPFVIATPFLGSIAIFAYFVYRSVREFKPAA
jgi:hypothetical protein